MAPPLIVVNAHAGPINRRLGRVVVEIDHRPWPIPWGMAVEIAVDSGIHDIVAYLVLADTPWPFARKHTGARAKVVVANGDQRCLEYRPSRLFSGAYHGRLRLVEAEVCDPASAATDSG
jgi:hypothetical protein